MNFRTLIMMLVTVGAATLTGCGGGGGGSVATTVVSGVASKGPLNGGTVLVYPIDAAGVQGSVPLNTKEIKTKSDGSYAVDLGAYQGAVLVEVRGGTYVDEANPALTKNLLEEAPAGMRAVVASVSTGNFKVAVTPFTELAVRKMESSGTPFTPAAISQANAEIASFFNLPDIVATVPANALSTAAASAALVQKEYAVKLAAVSQYLTANGQTLGTLLDDAKASFSATGGLPADTIAAFNSATQDFLNSANNKTGLTPTTVPAIRPAGGVLKLRTSGVLPGIGSAIGGIDLLVTLPAGVTVKADSFGQTLVGVVTASGAAAEGSAAANSTISLARFTAATDTAPATVRVILANGSGFGVGDFLTINCDVAASADPFPSAAAFSLTGTQIIDGAGAPLSEISASVGSFTVLVQ